MKISQFVLASAGFLLSDSIVPAVIFGVLAFISFRRAMREVQEMEAEDLEGGEEDAGRTF